MSGLDTLRQLIGRHARNSHGPSPIEGLLVTATDAPTVPLPGVAEPSLGLVIQGGKRTVSGDRVFDYAAGEFLVSQLDLPVIGQVTAASAGAPLPRDRHPPRARGDRGDAAGVGRPPSAAHRPSRPASPSPARTSRSWTRWRIWRACSTLRGTCRSSRPSTGARCSGGC